MCILQMRKLRQTEITKIKILVKITELVSDKRWDSNPDYQTLESKLLAIIYIAMNRYIVIMLGG